MLHRVCHLKVAEDVLIIIFLGIWLMGVIYNSGFVHRPRGIMVDWVKTNKQAECVFMAEKVNQGWGEICGQMPKRQLTVWVFGRTQEWFRSFLSGLGWHRHQPCPRHNRSYSVWERERGREGERERDMSGWGGVEEVWRLSLPWSPMALLTIQHPPNYPPIHSQRDKASVLVCWSNMATNLSLSNITPTSLSLQVRHGQVLHKAPFVLSFVTRQQTSLLNSLRSSFCEVSPLTRLNRFWKM